MAEKPVIIPRSEHPISRKLIDPDAVKVLYRLYRAGHTAYLVGGGVRDLYLQRRPKDFDIVTSARPAQVKKLFRNCRLIGRRFRLAHIHFLNGKIIELSTFRAQPEAEADAVDAEDLLVRSDNKFGNPRLDAERRDFTINSLFYDIATFSLIDYVDALQDVKNKIVRTIGDPRTRFQEDPVRMIRAIKFSARLGFSIEEKTWDALVEFSPRIEKSPQPRVLEELSRLLEEGAAERSFELLDQSGLLEFLEPNLEAYLRLAERGQIPDDDGRLVFRMLRAADDERAAGRKLPRPLLFSLWVYPMLLEHGFLDVESPEAVIRDCAIPVLLRRGLARKDVDVVHQILMLTRRLLQKKKRKRSAGKPLSSRDHFAETLLLLKIWNKASGQGREELSKWRDALEQAEKRFTENRQRESLPEPEVPRTPIANRRRRLVRRRNSE